jgi:magnesium chelatase subunit D
MTSENKRLLCQTAIELGIEGNRVDTFACRAARASAALAGRSNTIEEDLVTAIRFVLLPRSTREDVMRAAPGDSIRDSDETRSQDEQPNENSDHPPADAPGQVTDLIIQALPSPAPETGLQKRAQARTRSRVAGKHSRSTEARHGKYVRSTVEPAADRRVAFDATLRAAAPYQKARKKRAVNVARRASGKADDNQSPGRVLIKKEDLRFKRLEHKSGVLFIFVVDASGSMAVGRMAQAKGSLIALLQRAYLRRDTVALISLRGDSAEVLLAPTRSVALARRLLEAMPAGGGTPLSAGLLRALQLARQSRKRGARQVATLLFTDGRANVPLKADSTMNRSERAEAIESELREIGSVLAAEEIDCLVVDTQPAFMSGGEARRVAQALRAGYVQLPFSVR